ncbi:hypothetical protein SARC_01776 [Sphaeroforma arctica JP610]|uniref:Uncharacterized protein n=1 Tax=Sphaeroforma arctica JP610 TaxID=667725 RepID=A0A0L0GAX9_9EUKA|nr:hypothetical protein SARC_01776 [Sphaeroforma arctica JP610]KNC86051.1 hypothetical protein SARC_01776 [Sphaeroforma arctica JP610]|eukprot:XP_014159953.1 hypothetical protein SARC_01776 [Sphaeroforma arctica JP610]
MPASPCPIVGFGPRSGSCSTSGNIKSRGTSASVSSFGNSPLTLEKEKGLISSMIGSLFTPSQGNMASVTTNTTITKAEAEQNALHSFNFRPKGLPPKNPEEVEKQRIEVDRIHAMLIQKELDEAKKMEAREHAIMVNVGKWKVWQRRREGSFDDALEHVSSSGGGSGSSGSNSSSSDSNSGSSSRSRSGSNSSSSGSGSGSGCNSSSGSSSSSNSGVCFRVHFTNQISFVVVFPQIYLQLCHLFS